MSMLTWMLDVCAETCNYEKVCTVNHIPFGKMYFLTTS